MSQSDRRDVAPLIEGALARRANEVQLADLRAEYPAIERPGWRDRLRTSSWGLPVIAAACSMVLAAGIFGGRSLLTDDPHEGGPAAVPTVSSPVGPSGTPMNPDLSQSASSPPASTPAPAGPCASQDVELTPTRGGTYSGDGLWIVLVYTNVGVSPCQMPLYPSAAVLDSAGGFVESIAEWDGVGGMPEWPREPKAVTVAPGERASALLQWGAAVYRPGDSCSVNANVAVSLSQDAMTGMRLSAFPQLGLPARMCGEAVTAFVAGSTGTT